MYLALTSILLLASFGRVRMHGYLAGPISRNALSLPSNNLCSWAGPIPCTGDSQSWNQEEPTTGCAIKQGGGSPYAYGDGALGYKNTGYKTSYMAGEVVTMTAKMTAHHGGRLDFRIQDVGGNDDPDGSLWASSAELTVESFSPACDDPSHCGYEPCVSLKTCAQVPLSPFGSNNGVITMQVRLPDIICAHCVLQWKYTTANSCGGSGTSCDSSEKFWNCADIELLSNSGPTRNPTAAPSNPTIAPVTPAPTEALQCFSHSPDYTDQECRTQLNCDPWYCTREGDPTIAPTLYAPSRAPVEVGSCHSIVAHISDEWCRGVSCDPTYSEYCSAEPEVSTSPTTSLPPTSAAPTVDPASTAAPSSDSNSRQHVGIYEWTWVSGAVTLPPAATMGVAFSGHAVVATALSESAPLLNSLPGQKYLSLGGGNSAGHFTAARIDALNIAMSNGDLAAYDGICYDIEEGDAGLAAAFEESFEMAKTNGFLVLVSVSHSAPYGFTDKIQLMDQIFDSDHVDILSPQLYTSGSESSNDFDWDGVPWSSYSKSKAVLVPSIVEPSFYADAEDFFARVDRSGGSVATHGYIQWKQTYASFSPTNAPIDSPVSSTRSPTRIPTSSPTAASPSSSTASCAGVRNYKGKKKYRRNNEVQYRSVKYQAIKKKVRKKNPIVWSSKSNARQNSWIELGTCNCKDIPKWKNKPKYSVGDVVQFKNKMWEALKRNKKRKPSRSPKHWGNIGSC